MAKTILQIVLPEYNEDKTLEIIHLNEEDSALFEETGHVTDEMCPVVLRAELVEGQTLGAICIAFEDNELSQACMLTD